MILIKGIRIETTPQNVFQNIGIYLTPDLGFSKILSIDKNERKLFKEYFRTNNNFILNYLQFILRIIISFLSFCKYIESNIHVIEIV